MATNNNASALMGMKMGLKQGMTSSWLDSMSLKAYINHLDVQ